MGCSDYKKLSSSANLHVTQLVTEQAFCFADTGAMQGQAVDFV